jgi:hypothetical protein
MVQGIREAHSVIRILAKQTRHKIDSLSGNMSTRGEGERDRERKAGRQREKGERPREERERGETQAESEGLPQSFFSQIRQFGENGLMDEIRARAGKWRRPGHEHIADDPRRPDVTPVVIVCLQHLWGGVIARSDPLSDPLSGIKVLTQAEVDQNEIRVGRPVTEQKIL